jgi:3-phenylpropionate/trans-cinnamate dioxygenase ferredoxin reductase subunit
MTRRLVVVGASVAGGTAAATFRERGFDGDVTLIGAEPHAPYERPPLSKSLLRGETPFDHCFIRPDAFWSERRIDARLGVAATSIDLASKVVNLADGSKVPFDRLLLATGARNRRFPLQGLDLEGVYSLRTIEEAERIRAEIVPGRRAVLAGMGFIGSEVAASLRLRGVDVTVVAGGVAPLDRVLGEDVGRVLEGIHRDRGVAMHFGLRVAGFEGDGRVQRVLTAEGRSFECDFAVLGLGVEPVTDLAEAAGLDIDGGVAVDESCRTSHPDVFAAGDVASHQHAVFGRRVRVEHWQNALRQGRAAALAMLDQGGPYADVHWFWSEQYEHRLEYAGFHREWDRIVVRGSMAERSFAAFYIKDDRVQAVVALDRAGDVKRAIPLIRSGARPPDDALRDPDVELASLA